MFCASTSANVLSRSPSANGFAALGCPLTVALRICLIFGQALDVVDVGMRGDHGFAIGERKIELANQIDNFVDRLLKADIDQHPFVLIEHQVHVAAHPLAGLVIHFDDVRKQRLSL